MAKIAINGFGRIGRPVLKRILNGNLDLDVVAINDLADREALEHLFKYDSVYGIYEKKISEKTKFFSENDPSQLPWKKLGVDIVLECSGEFTEIKEAEKHLEAGAKKVIISAPSKEAGTFILGVNEENYDAGKDNIVSMASCTTNCLAPVAKVLNDNFKIVRGFMTTSHSYTNDQRILDLPHKDLRRARAAGLNIIPTTTGAALAIGKVIPELEGKLDGIALRVPTPTVSILDFICQVEKKTTAQETVKAFRKASQEKKWQGILRVEDNALVSSDFKGDSFSAIVDSNLVMAKDNLIKVVAWYDNEWGYACRLAELASYIGKKL